MLESIKDSKIIVLGGFLALSVMDSLKKENMCVILSERERDILPQDMTVLLDNSEKKANLTMNIVMNALQRKFDVNHDHKIKCV